MEHFESTSFGLRVVLSEWISLDYPLLKIRLFPMIHIGERKFYETVEQKLMECDAILYEAFRFRTGSLKIPNLKITADKLGLITQNEMDMAQFGDRLLHADLDKTTGAQAWSELTFMDKFKFNYILPIYLYFQDRNLTRRKLVKYFMRSNTDLEEIYAPVLDEKETIKRFIHEKREKRVFEEIDKIHESRHKRPKRIGIIYGAGHMKAITRYIKDTYDYKILGGEFVEVFRVV